MLTATYMGSGTALTFQTVPSVIVLLKTVTVFYF